MEDEEKGEVKDSSSEFPKTKLRNTEREANLKETSFFLEILDLKY